MLDDEPTTSTNASDDASTGASRPRRRAASRPAGAPVTPAAEAPVTEPEAAAKPPRKRAATKKATAKKAAAPAATAEAADMPVADAPPEGAPARKSARTRKSVQSIAAPALPETPIDEAPTGRRKAAPVIPTFLPPEPVVAPPRKRAAAKPAAVEPELAAELDEVTAAADEESAESTGSRRRSRGRRGRGGSGGGSAGGGGQGGRSRDDEAVEDGSRDDGDDDGEGGYETVTNADGTTTRRRRRRRRRRGGAGGEDEAAVTEDGIEVVVHVREPRQRKAKADREPDDEVRGVQGSTRLEARKQRRREGRDQGRKRVPIITEAEFLARRESVDRVMVVRQTSERTQVAVLEDGVLVEHFVSKTAATSYVGNVYLGRVQNVLPSMEAAFVDIGKGRNAVLYAGEVNWDAAGLEGQPRRIESALKPGQPVLVQVTKDPIGHKGARLTSQVSLPGRFVALVPDGTMTGISRKLPENERTRLKSILKKVMPEGAGVIVRTAAEGASEEELTRDINRLSAQWADIQTKAEKGDAPALLYAEPDLTVRVIRDVFNEDFNKVIVQGADEWDLIENYVAHVAPDLVDRLEKWVGPADVFAGHRIDEQLAKGLDRKVWLPSGGSLVIDRTEAMTVIDVNTGKFVGQGGNLEETVTRNNLEAAEEVVRQLRLRDIGGIIVVDFIDMVLESNRDLVLRRLVECLGRDRTKHQVAEVTSLGLVQMTRKRVGQGLLEAFSETCECCNGRGVKIHLEGPPSKGKSDGGAPERRSRKGKGGDDKPKADSKPKPKPPSEEAKAAILAESGDAQAPGTSTAAENAAEVEEAPAKPARKRRRAVKLSPVDAAAGQTPGADADS